MGIRKVSFLVSIVALLLVGTQPATAKGDKGNLVIHTHPRQAYIYADGVPYVESKGHYIMLSPGEHKIDIYNYGYRPESRKVTIVAGKTWVMDVTMQKLPGQVSGPWGCITIEGAPHAAVLLNGKDPSAFFVGHGDEFDNELIWHQELIVPPGRQELTLEYGPGDPWTTTVDVEANKRVVVDAYKGVRKTVSWSRGEQMKELPQFQAGIASAQVVVEKVAGSFSANSSPINCGDSANLTWSSKGASKVTLNGEPVSSNGQQTVRPNTDTTYKLTVAGPGGVYTSDATVKVNNTIDASLNVTPSEVNYQGSSQPRNANVTWSAANASSVTLDPIGQVAENGSREVSITPTSNAAGAIDQNVTYTLHATNACGGSETRTASLHLTGEPQPAVANGSAAPPTELAAYHPPAKPAELPHTASRLPLMGLIGILFLAAAASLRVILKISV